MKIKDIKNQNVRRNAEEYATEIRYGGCCRTLDEATNKYLTYGFNWGKTPEGYTFWWNVNENNIE